VKWHREPLIHFLAIGALLFSVYLWLNDPYETFGPMAYAAGQVYVQAVAAAQKKGKVTRAAILKELNTGKFKTLIGDFSFDENGMLDILHIAIYRVENGKWQIKYRTDRKATTLTKVE